MRKPMTLEQRKILESYKDTEVSAKELGVMAGVFYKTVFNEYRKAGGRHLYNAEKAHNLMIENLERRRLSNSFRMTTSKPVTFEDRKIIEKLKDSGLSGSAIAKKIGRHKNVVNREYRFCGGKKFYSAELAQKNADEIKESRYQKFRKIVLGEPTTIEVKQIDTDIVGDFAKELKFKNPIGLEETSGISKNLDIPRLPLKIWIDRWKEEKAKDRRYWSKEKRYFDFWLKLFGNEIAIDIKPIAIEGAADELLKVKSRLKRFLGEETRRKYLAYLSSLYSTAIYDWKWAVFNPLNCVKMKIEKKQYETINSKEFKEYDDFKIKFIAMLTEKVKGMTQREAAKKAGLTLNTFQYAMNAKNNPTVKVFIKLCVSYGIKVDLNG